MENNWKEEYHYIYDGQFKNLDYHNPILKEPHNTITNINFLRFHVIQKIGKLPISAFYFKTAEDFVLYLNNLAWRDCGAGRYLVLPYFELVALDTYSKFIWDLSVFGRKKKLYDNQFEELVERAKDIMTKEILEMVK